MATSLENGVLEAISKCFEQFCFYLLLLLATVEIHFRLTALWVKKSWENMEESSMYPSEVPFEFSCESGLAAQEAVVLNVQHDGDGGVPRCAPNLLYLCRDDELSPAAFSEAPQELKP